MATIPTIIAILLNAFMSGPGSDDEQPVSFREDIFPVIESSCLPCHAQAERNLSRLFLDSYELLMKGGYNGPPVIPGKADESLLVMKIGENPPFGDRMPMRSKEFLSDEQIRLIGRWIDEGAKNN